MSAPASIGTVVAFDEGVGLGEIVGDGTAFPFHCASIADGTRTIEVGTRVRFTELLKLGRREADAIQPV